jgi:hypothetical protein
MTSFLSDMTPTMQLFRQLESLDQHERLASLQSLRNLEKLGRLDASLKAGPVLPSYDHVHTTASYGRGIPGVYSVARMVWAAHEACAYSILMVEHESLLHCEEAKEAVAVVNRDAEHPVRLVLGVEFKTPLALRDAATRRFAESIAATWGQGEAAWVVGIGIEPSEELTRLVALFQKAKRLRAEEQLERLNRHLHLDPPLTLSAIATPEGNITDRSLCFHVARAIGSVGDPLQLARAAAEVRTMLNPGNPGYVPFSSELPCYQDLTAQLLRLGMTPTFTAQLRGQPLDEALPLLKSWGIRGLDVAGVEPESPHAERDIQQLIGLAEKHGLALFGGSDYRGSGTGWQNHAAWMDTPLIRESLDRVSAFQMPHAACTIAW